MKISHINIRNILGISDLEFSPAGFTTIAGANGSGKTSVLEAIKSVLKSGHDATLLRNGADKGEVVFVLDDGMEITRRVTESASTTEVRGADGKKIARPAEAIRAITDLLSVNPVEFLTAPKKDRVKVLLEAMPLEVDVDELTQLSGIRVTAQPSMHALHVIEAVIKQVYDDRTGTNRAIKEKDGTINQIRLAMPDAVAGVDGSEDELTAAVMAATTARDTMHGKIRAKLDGIKSAAQTGIDALRVKLQADIDALKQAAQTQVDAINADTNENVGKAATATKKASDTHTAVTAPLNDALAAIRANRSAAAKREQAIETIDTLVAELEELKSDSAKQTAALADIDAYKSRLLSSLPIPGLEVRDGEIFRNEVPFDRLNTAQQVDVAVEIAKLRAGELGVVCVDGLELLDSGSFDAFRDSALESGLQLFVTRVGDESFAINTQD